ncbi:substrate-binding periplasmic protein [Catenovulum sediminis]|uniref:ABC transporter substrate-binding protein n=1 Tax=Catenovulum sediminis TaxID=1740262 RepID=A0ABV1RI79_9ALTE
MNIIKKLQINALLYSLCSILILYSAASLANDVTKLESKSIAPSDIQKIINKGVLDVAMYARDTPPFYFKDENGDLAGVDVEIIRGFAKLLGVDVRFNRDSQSFQEVVDRVYRREADVAICKLSITFNRVKKVLFTKPYIELHHGLLVNRLALAEQLKGKPREAIIQKLKGKIGVIGNSSYETYARKFFPKMEIQEYSSWDDVVSAAIKGEITAAYRDEVEIKKYMKNSSKDALNLLTVVLKDTRDYKGIAVAWNNYTLKQLLDFYIDSLNLDLTADRVLENYDEILMVISKNTKG